MVGGACAGAPVNGGGLGEMGGQRVDGDGGADGWVGGIRKRSLVGEK